MARQNFQFGKRQRELAKKQKRDEKLQRKLERKNNPSDSTESADSTEAVESADSPEAGSEERAVQPEVEP